MSSGLNLVLLLTVIVTAVGYSLALTCIYCDSGSNSYCDDPFKYKIFSTCTGPSCTKSWAKRDDRSVLMRDCSPVYANASDDCADFQETDAKICWCSRDYCNAGYLLKPTSLIPFALIAVFTIFTGY